MLVVDVNLLIHAVNRASPHQTKARAWLEGEINDNNGLALPWTVLIGFVRLSINPKVMIRPLTLDEALTQMREWIALPNVIILSPTSRHDIHFDTACRASKATHNLITDAHLAALAIEHDCELASCDTDFAKFPGLKWINPIAE